MRDRVFLLVFSALNATCTHGPPARPVPVAPARSVSVVATAHPTATVLPRVPVPDPNARAWIAAVETDGTRDVIVAGLRARITPGGVTIASERFEHDLISATPVSGGWVFVAEDGTAARSESFLGALMPVPGLACAGAITAGRPSRGRALVAARDGHKWWTLDARGEAFVEWMPAFASRPLGVAFGDHARGVAILEGGAVMQTTDGGTRWSTVDLAGGSAWDVGVDETGIVLATPAGRVGVDRDGATRVLSPNADLTGERVVSPADRAAVGAGAARARASVLASSAACDGASPPPEVADEDAANGDTEVQPRFAIAQWDCGFAGPHVHAPMAYRTVRSDPGDEIRTAALDQGSARVDVIRRGNGPVLARAQWRGPGVGFATREVESPIAPRSEGDDDEGPDAELYGGIVLRAPRGLLFYVSNPAVDGSERFFWAEHAGGFVPAPRLPGAPPSSLGAQPISMSLPDGGTAVFAGFTSPGTPSGVGATELRYDTVWVFDRTGILSFHRDFVFAPGDGEHALARRNGAVGVLLVAPGPAPTLRFYPLETATGGPEDLGPLPTRPAAACRGVRGPGDVEAITQPGSGAMLFTADQRAVMIDDPFFAWVASVTLEIGTHGACVRSATGLRGLRAWGHARNESVRLTARGVRLEGEDDDGVDRIGVRCVPHRDENLEGIDIPE